MGVTIAPLQLAAEILKRKKTNRRRGLDVAWSNANEFISLKRGYPIMVAGTAGVGKTEIVADIAINAAIMHGFKICWLSPEMGDRYEITEQIIEKLSQGKVLEANENSLTDDETIEILTWVNKHVRIIDPTVSWKGTMDGLAMNIDNLFKAIQESEQEMGSKFDMIIIDPFNELDIDWSNIMNSVKTELDALLWWAKKNNYIPILTNHVTDVQEIRYTAESKLTYMISPPAKKEKWAYGQQWARKGYQMILVYEPHKAMQEDKANDGDKEMEHSIEHFHNVREIYVQKSKPKGVGKTGMFRLFYDRKKQRYYNIDSLNYRIGMPGIKITE